jgi:polysaccharide export outer membrane protein/exopolysaccharide production protein ExoF
MPADAPAYTLGAQDKIRLKVYEWRATVNTVFAWTSLNAEFTVGADGAVSLPILGDVPASGQTPAALAKDIGERLKSQVALSARPNVAVEVVEYRPFYILGGVNKPGEYPYRPGLTVLQALSIAGGVTGSGESGARTGNDIILRRGELRVAQTEANALLARKARLQAELDNADKIAFPTSLERRSQEPLIAVLLKQERAIFDTRRNALHAQIEVLKQLKLYLEKQVTSIEAQIKAQKDEEAILRKELKNMTSLVKRGLAARPRQLSLERTASRLEGERLRLEGTLLKAKQDISRAEVEILDARNRRTTEAATELRKTQAELERAITKFETTTKMLFGSLSATPQNSPAQPEKGRGKKADEAKQSKAKQNAYLSTRFQPVYTIVRLNAGGKQKELSATEAMRILPGDTIKVELPLEDGFGLEAATQ